MNHLKSYRPLLIFPTVFIFVSCAMNSADMMSAGNDFGDTVDTNAEYDTETVPFNDNYYPMNSGTDEEPSALIPSSENGVFCEAESNFQYKVIPPSTSTAGAVLARFAIKQGSLPPTPIRDSEFLNYYYPDFAEYESTFPQLFIQALPISDASGDGMDLKFAVAVPSIDTRLPLNLVLAVDTSSSMEGQETIIAKAACRAVFENIVSGDRVSVVKWNTVSTTMGADTDTLADASICDQIASETEAGTDIPAALTNSYIAAAANASASVYSHILIVSDGGASAGITDKEMVEKRANPIDGSSPIYLSTLGTASSSAMYNENVMKMVADAGKGAHYFADSEQEVKNTIKNRFFQHLKVAARNVTFQLTVPPQFEAVSQSTTDVARAIISDTGVDVFSGSVFVFHEFLMPCEDMSDGGETSIAFSMSFTLPNEQAPQIISVQPQSTDTVTPAAYFAKTDIVLLFAEALRTAKSSKKEIAVQKISQALSAISSAEQAVQNDADIVEIGSLLTACNDLL